MKALIGIQFKAGQRIYDIGPTGEYEMSNLNNEDLIELKRKRVESYKMILGISAPTEWII